MNNRQTRDWVKQHHDKKVRSTAKRQQEAALTKHHNELLARFYGKPAFSSEVANKVNQELANQSIAQLINEPIRHIV
jgi:hypothetical protein